MSQRVLYGPYHPAIGTEADAADIYAPPMVAGPALPTHRLSAEAQMRRSRERRRFAHLDDPWAPRPTWLTDDDKCSSCGGSNGHGGSCPIYLEGMS